MEDYKAPWVKSKEMERSILTMWSCPLTRSGLLNYLIFFAKLQNFVHRKVTGLIGVVEIF